MFVDSSILVFSNFLPFITNKVVLGRTSTFLKALISVIPSKDPFTYFGVSLKLFVTTMSGNSMKSNRNRGIFSLQLYNNRTLAQILS